MNILKRPMFYSALICCVAASLSLLSVVVSYAFLIFALILLIFLIYRKNYKYITVLFAVVLFAVSLFFELLLINNAKQNDDKTFDGDFLVISEPIENEKSSTVTFMALKDNQLPKNSKYLVFCENNTNLKIGDVVKAKIKISAINQYSKYRISNYSNGVFATAEIKALDKTGESNAFYHTAGNIRGYVRKTITGKFSGDSAGLLLALTTGDRTLLSDEFLHNVKTTGISHVIVVSGMHLSIIMAAVFWLVDRIFYNKYIRSILSIAVVLVVSSVCGFTMSIIRAGLMFIIGALAPVFERDNDSLSSLMTAITVVAAASPFAVFNVSFLLSVLSTLAIVWLLPFYYEFLNKKFKITSKIIQTILATVLCSTFAIITTLPVTIKVFSFTSIVAPITNLLITIPVTFVLVLNVLGIVLSLLPFGRLISYAVFWVANFCSRAIVYIVNDIAKLPITVAVLPKIAFWWSLLIVALIIGFMYFYSYKSKRKEVI